MAVPIFIHEIFFPNTNTKENADDDHESSPYNLMSSDEMSIIIDSELKFPC